MSRSGLAILCFLAIAGTAAPAQAQWFSNFWEGMHRDKARNKAWPEPFLKADRDSVNLPLALMVANGWRRQNLLSDYHFTEDNQQLNLAGETKLRFILTQMPPNRRIVFVQRGLTTDVTGTRLELVNTAALKVLGDRPAQVVESDLPNDGTPAEDINAVARRFQATRPDPRLSNASSGGGGGGGGGGSGGGGGGTGTQ